LQSFEVEQGADLSALIPKVISVRSPAIAYMGWTGAQTLRRLTNAKVQNRKERHRQPRKWV